MATITLNELKKKSTHPGQYTVTHEGIDYQVNPDEKYPGHYTLSVIDIDRTSMRKYVNQIEGLNFVAIAHNIEILHDGVKSRKKWFKEVSIKYRPKVNK